MDGLAEPASCFLHRRSGRFLHHTDHEARDRRVVQLLAPGFVGAGERAVDAAWEPVFTSRYGSRSAAPDLAAAERRLIAVDRLHHIEHRNLVRGTREPVATAR